MKDIPPFAQGESSFIEDFYRFVQKKQFYYSKENIIRFVTSLQTKPFVILSGISGTGKTKLAQLLVDYLFAESEIEEETPIFAELEEMCSTGKKEFQLSVQPYHLQHHNITLAKEMVEWMNGDRLEIGKEVEVHFQHQSEKAWLKMQKNGSVRLTFRKQLTEWMRKELQVGDLFRFIIDEDGETFTIERLHPQKTSSYSNVAFLSVRPDWLDHRGLLGSYHPLTEKYEATPLLEIMLKAKQHPNQPYFLILDEMNLAKVEYYFSDFLSCLESRRLDKYGQVIQETIQLHNQPEELMIVDQECNVYDIPNRIEIPLNLYIIGSVNIDETTYMFSPKVLDRANVIELNEVDIEAYVQIGIEEELLDSPYTMQEKWEWFTNQGQFHIDLYHKTYRQAVWHSQIQKQLDELILIHRLLADAGFPFGYRVVDEVMTYLVQSIRHHYCTPEQALDAQIMQKILPKLHGNKKQMERLLPELIKLLTGPTVEKPRYPLSVKKGEAMYKQLVNTGYCSFISLS